MDSVFNRVMDEHHDYKLMKTGDATWAKVDKMIAKPHTQLLLLEVPKGVSTCV